MSQTPVHARIISVTGLAAVMVCLALVLELAVKPASIRRLKGESGRDPIEDLIKAGWTSHRFDNGMYRLEMRDRVAPDKAELALLGEVRSLHSLTIQNVDLTAPGALHSIVGLHNFRSTVRVLDLSNSRVRNLSPLHELHALDTLALNGARGIDSLEPVGHLTALRRLYLGNQPGLTDLRPLTGMVSLEKLYLGDCPDLADLSPLASLTNLEEINLLRCVSLTDLTPLAGLRRLDEISLGGCTGITDIRPLGGLSELRHLSLAGCSNLEDIDTLAILPNLERVNLTGCPLIRHIPASLRNNPRLKIIRDAGEAAE